LLLKLDADTALLVRIRGVEPRGVQGLNARARRPSVPAGLAVGTDSLVAIGFVLGIDLSIRVKNMFQPPLSGGA
jgi:hypothetical protein